ncbi:MAG TPA: hypothetical protein VFO01_05665 [Trebonia sp.]|nr:hypothetical protein [Trebonia sp.]
MEEAVQSLRHDITELLSCGTLWIGERIVAELRRVPAVPTESLRFGGMVEKEPVFVINLWEECDVLGAMYRQDRTADEYILVSASLPMPVADDGVIREVDGAHPNSAIRPEHRRYLAKVRCVQVPYVVVQEKYSLPANHPGQQQANITFGTQVAVRVNAAVREP